jgi:hypothetical protein
LAVSLLGLLIPYRKFFPGRVAPAVTQAQPVVSEGPPRR